MVEEFDAPDIGDVDLDRPLRSRFSQFQLWSSSQIANVARRPTDLLVLAACAVGLMLILFLVPEDLLTGLSVNPGLATIVDSTLLMGSIALIIWSLVIVGASVLSKTHRVLVVQLLIAVAIGWVFSIFSARQIDMIEIFQIGSLGAWTPSWSYTLIIPVCSAVVSAASPFVSRPARMIGRVLIGGALLGSIALADFLPTRSVALVLIAIGAVLSPISSSERPRVVPHPTRCAITWCRRESTRRTWKKTLSRRGSTACAATSWTVPRSRSMSSPMTRWTRSCGVELRLISRTGKQSPGWSGHAWIKPNTGC